MNGWSNYQTWNVALYIQNEYPIYKAAQSYVSMVNEWGQPVSYEDFRQFFTDLLGTVTPDGVSYSDPTLDTDELDELLQEL